MLRGQREAVTCKSVVSKLIYDQCQDKKAMQYVLYSLFCALEPQLVEASWNEHFQQLYHSEQPLNQIPYLLKTMLLRRARFDDNLQFDDIPISDMVTMSYVSQSEIFPVIVD